MQDADRRALKERYIVALRNLVDATGKPIWHSHIGNLSNAPETYMLDGHQYVLVATGDALWSFMLY